MRMSVYVGLYKWHTIMKPNRSLLKFRLPYAEGITVGFCLCICGCIYGFCSYEYVDVYVGFVLMNMWIYMWVLFL
jgi:hypothetical protein